MKLLLSSLLLLCVRSPQSVSSDLLVVRQSRDVSVLEGQKVNISCCWTGRQSRFGVKWLKNQTSVKNETVIFQSEESPNVQANHCSFLVFKKITCRDSGKYTCKVTVEIPILFEATGNVTAVMVTHNEKIDHTDKKDHRSVDDKKNTARKPSVNKVDNTHHNIANEDKEKTIRKPKGSTVDNTNNHISNDGENTAKKPRGTKADNTNPHVSNDASQHDTFIFIMRCLPIISLITAFIWLYYLGTKAQQNPSAALGNKPTSAESKEDDQEEDEGHERKTEAEKTEDDTKTI